MLLGGRDALGCSFLGGGIKSRIIGSHSFGRVSSVPCSAACRWIDSCVADEDWGPKREALGEPDDVGVA
jgi:hypothetical protein